MKRLPWLLAIAPFLCTGLAAQQPMAADHLVP